MSQANFSDDATGVVEAIQDGVETAVITIGATDYTTRPVFFPPEKSDVRPLGISTLDGLIEYLQSNADNHNFSDLLVVVNDPRSVSVYAQIEGAKNSRTLWLKADYEVDSFPFERYLDHEQFMVKAQALICETGERAELLKFIGNVTTAIVSTSNDDGVSQSVVVESGVRKSAVELPNPVRLAPFRTFAEVEQPHSPFILRLKQVKDGMMPEIALFEADGGLWRIYAVGFIKAYLKQNLGEEITAKIPIIG